MSILVRAMLGTVLVAASLAPAQAPAPIPAPPAATAPASEPADSALQQRIEEIAAARRAGRLSPQMVLELTEMLRGLDPNDQKQLPAFASLGYLFEQIADDAGRDSAGPLAGQDPEALIGRSVEAYLRAGALARQVGDHGTAEQIYMRVLAHRRDNAEAVLGLARAYANTDRTYQAIDRYREYLESTKIASVRDPDAYIELAGIYARATSYQQAIRALDAAAKLAPSNPDVYSQMASVLANWGKPDEALAAISKARDLAPANPNHTKAMAQLLMEIAKAQRDPAAGRQRMEQALQAAREAMRKAQDQLQRAPEERANLESLLGCYEVYLGVLQMVVKADEKNLAIRMELVSGLQRRAEAMRVLYLHQALDVLNGTSQLVELKAALEGKQPNPPSPAELATEQNLALLRDLASLQMRVANKDFAQTCEHLRRLDPDNRMLKLPPGDPLTQYVYGGAQSAPSP